MFFRKTERKKHSACLILTVGALAAIGAVSITRSGKQIINELGTKVKGFFKKEACTCPTVQEDC
ncbi:MAG: hypothetical protein E7612_09080 [Ruminococcaceae bacterium]|nr:hypothetical protein [Oscillospiraceae bacterium]